MVQYLPIKKLRNFLSHIGPYMYFYDADSYGGNRIPLSYINSQAEIHKMVKIFRIKWEEQLTYNPMIIYQKRYNIFVYFEGNQKFEITNPSISDIDFLFRKCIEYHNSKIDYKIKNIGSKIKLKTNKINESTIKRRSLEGKSMYLERQKKNLLKRKVMPFKMELPPISKCSLFSEEMSKRELRIIAKRSSKKIKGSRSSEKVNYNIYPSQWFQEAGLTNLPVKFLDDEPIKLKQNLKHQEDTCNENLERTVLKFPPKVTPMSEFLMPQPNIMNFKYLNLNKKIQNLIIQQAITKSQLI